MLVATTESDHCGVVRFSHDAELTDALLHEIDSVLWSWWHDSPSKTGARHDCVFKQTHIQDKTIYLAVPRHEGDALCHGLRRILQLDFRSMYGNGTGVFRVDTEE